MIIRISVKDEFKILNSAIFLSAIFEMHTNVRSKRECLIEVFCSFGKRI